MSTPDSPQTTADTGIPVSEQNQRHSGDRMSGSNGEHHLGSAARELETHVAPSAPVTGSGQSQTTAPPWPGRDAPCNGCGMCCAAEVCAIGREAFPGASAPCPGMLFDEGCFHCKLVVIESMAGLEPMLATALGIGQGCDSYVE